MELLLVKSFPKVVFICYSAAPRPTLGHWRGFSLTNPIIIIVFYNVRPEGHQKPRNEVGSLSPANRLAGFELGSLRKNHVLIHISFRI